MHQIRCVERKAKRTQKKIMSLQWVTGLWDPTDNREPPGFWVTYNKYTRNPKGLDIMLHKKSLLTTPADRWMMCNSVTTVPKTRILRWNNKGDINWFGPAYLYEAVHHSTSLGKDMPASRNGVQIEPEYNCSGRARYSERDGHGLSLSIGLYLQYKQSSLIVETTKCYEDQGSLL